MLQDSGHPSQAALSGILSSSRCWERSSRPWPADLACRPLDFFVGLIAEDPAPMNTGFALVQLALGVGFLLPRLVRPAIPASLAWSAACRRRSQWSRPRCDEDRRMVSPGMGHPLDRRSVAAAPAQPARDRGDGRSVRQHRWCAGLARESSSDRGSCTEPRRQWIVHRSGGFHGPDRPRRARRPALADGGRGGQVAGSHRHPGHARFVGGVAGHGVRPDPVSRFRAACRVVSRQTPQGGVERLRAGSCTPARRRVRSRRRLLLSGR